MSDSNHFIVPVKYYIGTFIALLFLTFITVFVAQFDFGSFNIVVAMLVAIAKAALVVLFFMALRWDKGVNIFYLASGLLSIIIFLAFLIGDIKMRGAINKVEKGAHSISSPVKLIKADSDHHSKSKSH